MAAALCGSPCAASIISVNVTGSDPAGLNAYKPGGVTGGIVSFPEVTLFPGDRLVVNASFPNPIAIGKRWTWVFNAPVFTQLPDPHKSYADEYLYFNSGNDILSYGTDSPTVGSFLQTYSPSSPIFPYTFNPFQFLAGVVYNGPAFADSGVTIDGVGYDVFTVPEPSTWAMMLMALISLPGLRRLGWGARQA
jgi:hypothetical protein